MADQLHALAFNELSRALSTYSRFVPLSEREEITRRVVQVTQKELAVELATFKVAVEQVRADCESMISDLRGGDVDHEIWRKGVYAQARRVLNIIEQATGAKSMTAVDQARGIALRLIAAVEAAGVDLTSVDRHLARALAEDPALFWLRGEEQPPGEWRDASAQPKT